MGVVFCLILLTNKLTNADENITPLAEVTAVNSVNKQHTNIGYEATTV